MKDNHVYYTKKLFKLTDLDIKPFEICWNKVKMSSSRWITCCHRQPMAKGVYSSPSVSSTYSSSSASSSRHQIINSYSSTPKSNGKFDAHHKAKHQNPLNYYNGCKSSPCWSRESPSTSSPFIELKRNPSSLSSSSSVASSSLTNHEQTQSARRLKQSVSNYDLSHSTPHPAQPANRIDDECYSLSRVYADPYDHHSQSVEHVITIISPTSGFLVTCQTNADTSCAQINPELDIIAVSNDNWLAFYSIQTNYCLATLPFPSKHLYWTWINSETIALVTKRDVYHWRITYHESTPNYIQTPKSPPRMMFTIDESIKDNQITGYIVDPIFNQWCALSSLYIDDDGEISGKIQMYSHSYNQSQCIDAHCCTFTSYKFEDCDHESTLLIAANREKDNQWKLHIIELGPLPNGNLNHRSKTIHLMNHRIQNQNEENDSKFIFDDIPTNLACDNRIGLIYLISKYGYFYICDLETGTALHYDTIESKLTENSALFSFCYDAKSNSLVVISRSGIVFKLEICFSQLLNNCSQRIVQPKICQRITNKLQENKYKMVCRSKKHCKKSTPNKSKTADTHEKNVESRTATLPNGSQSSKLKQSFEASSSLTQSQLEIDSHVDQMRYLHLNPKKHFDHSVEEITRL